MTHALRLLVLQARDVDWPVLIATCSLQTSAVRKGDDFVINGEKIWITNGIKADWMCLLVNTEKGPAHKNKSIIIVPLDAKGSKTMLHEIVYRPLFRKMRAGNKPNAKI